MKTGLMILILIALNSGLYPKDAANKNKQKQKATLSSVIDAKYIDINNLRSLESNTGFSDFNMNSIYGGLEFPKGSTKTLIYKSGFLWGGFAKDDGQVRIGGSAYGTGLEPGPIMPNGQAALNPNTDKRWRVYRVRPDVYPGGPIIDLTYEAQLEGTTSDALRTQYETDWTEWPATGTSIDLGAPFTDVNGDGKYEAAIDIPGVHGSDQTIYYVANDLDSTISNSFYGTNPLGIEVHATYWAYKQAGAIGNVYFKKYTLINKGYQYNQIDNMFVSFWADPDLGSSGDDLMGTDTTLNLIYTYNGLSTDAVYAPEAPPCIGFSLLEGPAVNGSSTDTAFFNGRKLPGKKNLPMTASYIFVFADSNYWDPQQGSKLGAREFYRLFNSMYAISGQHYKTPQSQLTNYLFTGDPVAGTGWIDTVIPDDIKQGLASGPFTFAPGDTQEVVIAEIAGEGTDYLHSIYTVKEYQYYAANMFKNLTNCSEVPTPLAPEVTVLNNNNLINIQWDDKAESFNKSGYTFEGYNVYQLSSPYDTKESSIRIATFDKVDGIKTISSKAMQPDNYQLYNQLQQFGNDTGLQYSFIPSKDYINNLPFIKGKKYYYAVTAYSYNSNVGTNPNNTESFFKPVMIGYNSNLPGPNFGDTVKINHLMGRSEGDIKVVITDPSKVKGHSYTVLFDTSNKVTFWKLKDISIDSLLIKQELNSFAIVDGFNISVTGPKPGVKDWSIPQGIRVFSWNNAGQLGFEGFHGTIGWGSPDVYFNGSQETVSVQNLHNTLLVLAKVTDIADFNPIFPASDVNLSYGYRYLRNASDPVANPKFSSHIINSAGGCAFQDFTQSVPLSAWNVDDPANPQRLAVGYMENNVVNGLVDGKYWPPNSAIYDNTAITGPREWLWIFNAPYSTTINPAFEEDALSSNNPLPVMWFCTFARLGSSQFSPDQTGEDQFLITKTIPVTLNDVFTFNTSILDDVKKKKIIHEYSLSQNYPNPFNPTTTINFSIPKSGLVRIKIYDVLGREIRTLVNGEKPAGNYSVQFTGSNLSSGVYFYRMQSGNYVQTKKLVLLK
jgi:hypothetical protein